MAKFAKPHFPHYAYFMMKECDNFLRKKMTGQLHFIILSEKYSLFFSLKKQDNKM
jgi:hypothetical protein